MEQEVETVSWYPPTTINFAQKKYLKLIQNIFMVQDPFKRWVPYKLTPHQIQWHSRDIGVLGSDSKTRVVVKSRNTSFTTSTLISLIMAVPFYPEQVVPFVRLNQSRANDLIDEVKKLVKHMNVIELEDGSLFPFDPNKVDMGNVSTIRFPNGVEFRAFPATNQSAETIRGLRITIGFIDESNFMKDFESIYISMRDAAGGSILGKKHFQINIGTTLKGRTTPFHLWYDKRLKEPIPSIEIYQWPVFKPTDFNPDQDIMEQDITPIVPWHSKEDLEYKRRENFKRFMEEYMCLTSDSDEAFYPYDIVLRNVDNNLKICSIPDPNGMYYIGIDVASTHDFFAIAIMEKVDDAFVEKYLFYKRGVLLEEMQKFCEQLIITWVPYRVRVDANGMGFQLAQSLRKRFGAMVEPVRGSRIKGINKHTKLNLNEFIHTNLKSLMSFNKIALINDEMQINHFGMWEEKSSGKVEAPSNDDLGHGDLVIAIALAVLPHNFRRGKNLTNVITNLDSRYESNEVQVADIDKVVDVQW